MSEERIKEELNKVYEGGTWDYLINYIKNLQQENKNLNKYKEIFGELISLSNQELVKRNNDLSNILTEFEKWLEEKINNANKCLENTELDEDTKGYVLARKYMLEECLKRLQELKEGKK